MAEYGQEFNPELNDAFLQRLTGAAQRRGDVRRGAARSEALSRGLEGDVFESSAVGAASEATDREVGDIEGDFYYRLAGMNRDERLGEKARGYQVEDRNFGAAEAQKNRDFNERMARLGYDFSRDNEALQNRRGYQTALWNAGANLAMKGITAGLF